MRAMLPGSDHLGYFPENAPLNGLREETGREPPMNEKKMPREAARSWMKTNEIRVAGWLKA